MKLSWTSDQHTRILQRSVYIVSVFLFGIRRDFQNQNYSATNKLWETPSEVTGIPDNSVGMITKLQGSNTR